MARFDVKTKDGVASRLEEADIERLYRQGKIQMDTPCRRAGSPNWFRFDELFPHYTKIERGTMYRATTTTGRSTFHSLVLTTLMLVVLGVLLIVAIQRITLLPASSQPSSQKGTP